MVEFGKLEDLPTPLGAEQAALYQRLQAFSFDRPDSCLRFSQRLAKENNWSREFTDRAIGEYKKLAFLAVVAGHPVSPSDQVDQVWHLHLTYTRSYWEEFCPLVLQMPFHHEPTQGGAVESQKFEGWYGKTLESYQHWFGAAPPEDIWPAAAIRFGMDSRFVRVNAQQNWVVPKPSLPVLPKPAPQLALFLPLMLILTGCEAISGFPNPLDFKGQEFLAFYGGLMAIVIPGAFVFQGWLQSPDGYPSSIPALDTYEVAYLAGGKERVVDTALTRLVQQKFVAVSPESRRLSLEQPIASSWHPVEQAVAAVVQPEMGILGQVRSVAGRETEFIRDRLVQLNLLLSPDQSSKSRLYPLLPIAVLLGLGAAKIMVGVFRDKPVGFLVMLCYILILCGLKIFRAVPASLTFYGSHTLSKLCEKQQRPTSIDDDNPELSMLVALFGVHILADSSLTDLKTLLMPIPSSAYVGSGGDSGGGGGGGSCGGGSGCGGGGGCGGCGGG